MIVTCNQCGLPNRFGAIPPGMYAVCRRCRTSLGHLGGRAPKTRKRRSSKVLGAWAAIISIVGLAMIIDADSSEWRPALTSRTDAADLHVHARAASPRVPTFAEPLQPLPPHGKVDQFTKKAPVAQLQIKSAGDTNALVKLVDISSGHDVLKVFVHGGQEAIAKVPLGTYEVRWCSGEQWYGTENRFGPDTMCFRANGSFDFSIDRNTVQGYSLTLYRVPNGNLRVSRISPEMF